MDLIPSERAVLNLIRMLVLEACTRTHRVTLLRSRWPALHSQAYTGGYGSLIERGLIALSADGEHFSVTTAGLKAMSALR
jgi:predicted Zn-dependent protease